MTLTHNHVLLILQCFHCLLEFLIRCAEVYKSLLTSSRASHEPVVVPTSDDTHPPVGAVSSESGTGDTSQDGVETVQFLRSLIPIAESMDSG